MLMKALVAGVPTIVGGWQARGAGVTTAPGTTAATTNASVAGTQTQPAYRTKFEKGDAVGAYLNAVAMRFGVVVIVEPTASTATLEKALELPGSLAEAVAAGETTMASQGMTLTMSVTGDVTVLRAAGKDEAPATANGPIGIGEARVPVLPRVAPASRAAPVVPAVGRGGGGRGSRG